MGHTSPILGKKLETKILFQTLVSELKKKSFWGNKQNKENNTRLSRSCGFTWKQGKLPLCYQITMEERSTNV